MESSPPDMFGPSSAATVIGVMLTAFLSAVVLFLVFPVLAHVVGMFGHEAGHAITGWLLGLPSVPMPYLTLRYDFSWLALVFVHTMLVVWSLVALRTRPLLLLAMLGSLLVLVLVAVAGLSTSATVYMGNGGAVAIGGLFVYLAWASERFENLVNRGLVAFAGFSMTLDAFGISYRLVTDTEYRTAYSAPGGTGLGIDNDFAVLCHAHPWLTVEALATLTMALAATTMVLANLGGIASLALGPHRRAPGIM